jgi:peroxiredoxin Q/BCP
MRNIFFIIIALALIILMLSFLSTKDQTALETGDTIPSFTLKDQNGNIFDIDRYRGKQPLVIYFYPKDDTPGCRKEACSFRDEFEVFTGLNVKVIGISSDDVASHKKFAEKYQLPFTLLADTDKKVRKLFGVPDSFLGLIPGRVTYIVNKHGIIVHIFNNMTNAEKHITESLKAIKRSNE